MSTQAPTKLNKISKNLGYVALLIFIVIGSFNINNENMPNLISSLVTLFVGMLISFFIPRLIIYPTYYIGCYIKNIFKLIINGHKGLFRIAVSISILWLLFTFIGTKSYSGRNIDEFLIGGITPIVIFWCFIWICRGFLKSLEKPESAR